MSAAPTRTSVLVVIGTRPEAIKMAPVVHALRARSAQVDVQVAVTAQHRDLLDEPLASFGIEPEHDLDLMRPGQTPNTVAAAVLGGLAPILDAVRPDWVLVQGDTTTAFAAALAAFHGGIRVGHVEAGLRTGRRHDPFPEEVNRSMIARLADVHFAPTPRNRDNLVREGVDAGDVVVTGNTVIDALAWMRERLGPSPPVEAGRTVLVTAHRRESFGPGIENICTAIERLCDRYGDAVTFEFPVHPNPNVYNVVHQRLGDRPQVRLFPPLDYAAMVDLLTHAFLVLTDSGGLQEEAPSFGKPVLVLRRVTERDEAVDAGTVQLVGTDPDRIVDGFTSLWDDPDAYARMAQAINPYGDGRASARIVAHLLGEAFTPFEATAEVRS